MLTRYSSRTGYVLVLTLGLLALASISLASVARYSLASATSANTAAEELQRRWGLLSVRHVFTEQAVAVLDAAVPPEQVNTPPWPKPASLSTSFRLGGLTFSVLVSDEDAKANLNVLAAWSPDKLAAISRRLSQGAGNLDLRALRPTQTGRSYQSWGEVFDLANLSAEQRAATELIRSTRQITLWGSRQLNLRRASDEALREVASLALPIQKVGELVSLRKHWSGGEVGLLLAELDLRRPQLSAASRLFTNDSRNYSLWIEIDNGQREWVYQYVDDGGPACFAW
jgi:hypothetical protein